MDGHRGRDRLHDRPPGQRRHARHDPRPRATPSIADSGDHASILDGCLLSRAKLRPFRHNRLDKLERALERAAGDGGGVLVVVDGVFSMEGDVAPLPEIATCASATARGSWSTRRTAPACSARAARARAELLGVEDRVDLRMGTFSKSLASCGGFVAGPAEVVEFLRIQSRAFLFTASAVPAAVGAALAALRIVRSAEGPPLLAPRARPTPRYLRDGLRERGLRGRRADAAARRGDVVTPIVPVLVGDDWKAVAAVARALRRRRVRQHGAPPGGAAGRRAAAHERHGHARRRDARPRARRLRAGQGGASRPSTGRCRPRCLTPRQHADHEKLRSERTVVGRTSG